MSVDEYHQTFVGQAKMVRHHYGVFGEHPSHFAENLGIFPMAFLDQQACGTLITAPYPTDNIEPD